VVSSTPRPHFTPGKDPVPILQEAGWAPGPVWTGGKYRLHRDSIQDILMTVLSTNKLYKYMAFNRITADVTIIRLYNCLYFLCFLEEMSLNAT